MANRILSAFLDGFTGGSLFVPLRRPGAPTQVFADPDAEDYPQKELVLALLKQQALEDAQARAEASCRYEPRDLRRVHATIKRIRYLRRFRFLRSR